MVLGALLILSNLLLARFFTTVKKNSSVGFLLKGRKDRFWILGFVRRIWSWLPRTSEPFGCYLIRFLWMQYFYQFQTKLFLRLPIDRLLDDVFLIRLAARGRTKELYFLPLMQRPKVRQFSWLIIRESRTGIQPHFLTNLLWSIQLLYR